MHGRVKVRTTTEQEKIKEVERKKKAAEYKKQIKIVFQKRKNGELDDEILLISEKLLIKHPDVYTLWNIRRETFLNHQWSDEEYHKQLEKELILTEISLRENPKSYCVWHQRVWIIEKLPNPDWKRELELCNKCLNLDERNFHCWNHRFFVVKKANISDLDELDFTTSKIQNNFSNYSSWHYRSKLLPKLYPSDTPNLPIRADKYDKELDLVMNATFTDPNDTSSWFYYRWLLDYWRPPVKLWKVILDKESINVVFYKKVLSKLELFINGKKVECEWKSSDKEKVSILWYAELNIQKFEIYEEVNIKFEDKNYELKPSKCSDKWIYKTDSLCNNHNNSKLIEQLENYQTLSKMVPSNKWAKLTSIHLMLNIDPISKHLDIIIEELDQLISLDSLRKNYYKNMRDDCVLKYTLILSDD